MDKAALVSCRIFYAIFRMYHKRSGAHASVCTPFHGNRLPAKTQLEALHSICALDYFGRIVTNHGIGKWSWKKKNPSRVHSQISFLKEVTEAYPQLLAQAEVWLRYSVFGCSHLSKHHHHIPDRTPDQTCKFFMAVLDGFLRDFSLEIDK